MKKRLFFPFFIMFTLAILVISSIVKKGPTEEKIMKNATKVTSDVTSKLQTLIKSNRIQQEKLSDNSSEILTAERVYTETEIQNTTEIQFEQILKDTEARLPVLQDIKQLPAGALHHIPPLILEAGRNLGVIKEIIAFHPEYETLATPLYSKCALAENRPTTVRALCLTNLIEISKKNNLELDLKKYPVDVIELTKLVLDI
jgi:hypothetical protein